MNEFTIHTTPTQTLQFVFEETGEIVATLAGTNLTFSYTTRKNHLLNRVDDTITAPNIKAATQAVLNRKSQMFL